MLYHLPSMYNTFRRYKTHDHYIFTSDLYTYICGRTRGVVNIVLQNIFVILQKIQSSEKNQEFYKNANLDCGFLITLHKLEWFILKILAHAQKTCACGSKLILFFVVKKSGVRNLLVSLYYLGKMQKRRFCQILTNIFA